MDDYPYIEDLIGQTPLIRLRKIACYHNNTILVKLENNNPAGSVKDRAAFSMIMDAEQQGIIHPGDTLIEPTNGNTGIALAMVSAIRGYRLILVMPENQSLERRQIMRAYGAELQLTPSQGGMEMARDVARNMVQEGFGVMLDQFSNLANPQAHYDGTGPEIWQQTHGTITHLVSSLGTSGTMMGCAKYLKECNADIKITGCFPAEGAQIAGIYQWPEIYKPSIFDPNILDEHVSIHQNQAEVMCKKLAQQEGLFVGVSSGAAACAVEELSKKLSNSVIVMIACDRGERYLSTGLFPG